MSLDELEREGLQLGVPHKGGPLSGAVRGGQWENRSSRLTRSLVAIQDRTRNVPRIYYGSMFPKEFLAAPSLSIDICASFWTAQSPRHRSRSFGDTIFREPILWKESTRGLETDCRGIFCLAVTAREAHAWTPQDTVGRRGHFALPGRDGTASSVA